MSPIEFADRQSILLLNPGPERPAAGHQHHPLRDLDLQSGRRRAGAPAFAQRQPHHPVGQGRLHRRRRRALHRRPRRPDPHAERHLARPRQRFQRAGDLDRHARLAADGVPRRRLGRSRHAGRAGQHQRPAGDRSAKAIRAALYGHGGIKPAFVDHQRGVGHAPAPLFHYRGADVQRDAAQPAQGEGRPARGHQGRLRQPGDRRAGVQDPATIRRSCCARARRPSSSARPPAPTTW